MHPGSGAESSKRKAWASIQKESVTRSIGSSILVSSAGLLGPLAATEPLSGRQCSLFQMPVRFLTTMSYTTALPAVSLTFALSILGCSGGVEGSTGGHSETGGAAPTGGAASLSGGAPPATGGAPSGGLASGGNDAGEGVPGGGASGSDSTGGTVASGGASATGGTAGAPSLPATCSEAAAPFTIQTTVLDPALVPASSSSGFNSGWFAELPVAVDADGRIFVGFTGDDGGSPAAVVAEVGGQSFSTPGAVNGGIAATADGLGLLLFDPNSNVDDRTWAAVRRIRFDGSEVFQTDLFHSPNLEDEGTKGAPGTSRLGYIAGTDQLIAYFAHTQRYDDGVRHQGGYLATLDASGTQDLLSGWFGSHNLDQRLMVDASGAAVLGLGDAYPEGIFFSFVSDRPQTRVLYALASAGNGSTNGQLGGIVDLDDALLIPFITNESIPQDLDAGVWPDIDDAISQQIRDAAANGTDLGILTVPKTGANPSSELEPIWLDASLTDGARLERLKSARYGSEGLIFLSWDEATGSNRNATRQTFSMVVDRQGAICQPKTPLPAEQAFTGGDDPVRGPDGRIHWANREGSGIKLLTLTPGG